MKQRPYQEEAERGNRSQVGIVAALRAARSCLLVLPTGTGKTIVFAHIINLARGRCLVLAHRDELIRQAADKIKAVTGEYPEIEKADEYAVRGGDKTVVGSVQTMHKKKRLHQFAPDAFSLIIVDEAHRCAKKNKSYQVILDYFKDAKVLGVTATPDRHDKERIIGPGKVFEVLAYEYMMRQAIQDGWLVPVRQKFITVKSLDLSKIAIKPGPNGKDYDEKELAEILSQEKALHAVVEPALREVGDRQAIVFSAGVAHGKALCEIFNRYRDRCAIMLHGGDRRHGDFVERQVERFKSGEIQFLVNCMLFTEGFDYWNVGAIVNARPTKSRTVYCLDSETEILTPDGWVGMLQEQPAWVSSLDMVSGKIVWSAVIGKNVCDADDSDKFLSMCNEQLEFRVTDNHRMIWRTRRGRKRERTALRIGTAKEMMAAADMVEIPVSGFQDAVGLPCSDDQIRLLGWVLTDGCIGRENRQISITQSASQPWISEIDDMLNGCELKFVRKEFIPRGFPTKNKGIRWTVSWGIPRITGKHLKGWGSLWIAPYLGKFIHPAIQNISANQLRVLLEAMHLGDGSKQVGQSWTRRSWHIFSVRKKVVDSLQSLCVRRGLACNVSFELRDGGRKMYCLHIKDKQYRSLKTRSQTDSRKIPVFVEAAGETVWCLECEHGTLVTRRRGKVVIVGNSQMVGRGTRPDPLCGIDTTDSADTRKERIAGSRKRDLVVLDCVGAGRRLDLSISVADILAKPEEISAAVIQKAKKILEEGETDDVEECLEMARKILDQEAAKRVAARTVYTVDEVDPFQIAAILASRKQRILVAALSGQEPHMGLTARDASSIIFKLGMRPGSIQSGQIARLKDLGVEYQLRWSHNYARMMIDKFTQLGVASEQVR